MRPENIGVESLRLDPENPRVPEYVERTQGALLQYIFDRGKLDELAESFLDNGYFEPERIVVRSNGNEFVAVEGNRRLAALMILHQLPVAQGLRLLDDQPTSDQLNRLRSIPCLVLEPDEAVDSYLAYRHIGGLKTWSPEAKARFIKRLVQDAAKDGREPFQSVGRRVGSNALGVRNPFLALAILEHGRDELDIDTKFVQYERFGVWIRCMNSVEIKSYINLGDPRSYEEVMAAIQALDRSPLEEIVGDLSPRGTSKPVLQDSRDVTDYGRVLANEKAHAVLRRHDDLAVARQVIQLKSLPERIAQICVSVELVLEEIYRLDPPEDVGFAHNLRREGDRLSGIARTLRASIRELAEDD